MDSRLSLSKCPRCRTRTVLLVVSPLFLVFHLLFSLSLDASASDWVVLSDLDTTKHSERVRYAKFLKERHYEAVNRVIPELTPDEKRWLTTRQKAVMDALNTIKNDAPMVETEEGRRWLSMNGQFIGSTLFLQNELKRSLVSVSKILDILVQSKGVDSVWEMSVWSLLVNALLDTNLNGDSLNRAVSALEREKGIVFPKGINFLLRNMSMPIARGINYSMIYHYFEGSINGRR